MAAKKKAKVAVEPVEEDDEELDLDELGEDLEEESDVEEDDDTDEEDDADEAPKKSKSKKKKAKKESDTVGSADLAEALGTSGRELRVMLRQKKVKKNENNRYEWDSVDDALEALGFDDLDEAKEALAESRAARLKELKDRVADKPKKKAKKPVASDDEDDEDEEEETPPPKKKKKKTTA